MQLIDLLSVNIDEVDTSDCTDIEDILSAVITYLSELPSVDAVPVVRCKDCRYFDKLFKGENVINKIGTCHLRDAEEIETAESCDNFCSHGERKDK